MLFWLAMAMLLPAIVLGLSKSERPILESARGLFAPGGAVLMLYGALVWRERAQWIGLGADEPRRAGVVLLALGLAALAAGLAEVTGADAWRVFMIPAIVGGGVLSLREAWRGKRGTLYRINEFDSSYSWWLARAGLWMFGLSSPLLVLWALGVQSLD
jgi:hypothetical protein